MGIAEALHDVVVAVDGAKGRGEGPWEMRDGCAQVCVYPSLVEGRGEGG